VTFSKTGRIPNWKRYGESTTVIAGAILTSVIIALTHKVKNMKEIRDNIDGYLILAFVFGMGFGYLICLLTG